MKSRAAIFAAIAAIGILAGACSSAMGSPKQTTITVGYDEFVRDRQISKEITINEGTELIVNLASNPSTGYSWTQPTIENPAVLTQTGSEYVAPTGNAVGSAGTQVWTFKASEQGSTIVQMEYVRPWEGGEKGEWTFRLTVTVR